MHIKLAKQASSLFSALIMVLTMLGLSSLPVNAQVPAMVHSMPTSLSIPITTITRISLDSSGAQGNNNSDLPSISANGRYVAFVSLASNLVSGDANGQQDIFLRDTQAGITTLVSVASDGTQANGASNFPSISADGRYVAFSSRATNLVSGDTNGADDIFLHDTQTNTTTRLSVSSNGIQSSIYATSDNPSISADGRYVAFWSFATNLIDGVYIGVGEIYLRDTQMSTTTLISVDSGGSPGIFSSSYNPSVSTNGRYVAFESFAPNLVSGDTNDQKDIFMHDRQTGATTRLSVSSTGTQANSWCASPSISADGRYVAFTCLAYNLASGYYNGMPEIYLRDTQTSTTTRVSVNSSGMQGGGDSGGASISADGRYVTFSSSSILVDHDYNGSYDVFLRDTQTGTTIRLSVDSNGVEGNEDSYSSSISADVRYVAFKSFASNLVSSDTNGKGDIFVVPTPAFFPYHIYLPFVIR